MKKNLLIIVLFSAILAGLAGYGYFFQGGTPNSRQAPPNYSPEKTENPSGEPAVLPIFGESNELTAKQRISMTAWRQEAFKMAKANQREIFTNGPAETKEVCLTFDDGPDDVVTPQVINVLKHYSVKGNFFFTGNLVRRYSDVVRQAYQEGNLVLSHTYSHKRLSKMNARNISQEIRATELAFAEVIGRKPAMLRPPYGAINQEVINEASRHGYKIVLWSIDTLDWSQRKKDKIAQNVLKNVRPGDIVLMHCDKNKQATAEALPTIIEKLKEQGYDIVSLAEMLDIQPYQK